mmetsp:Transcript_89968/g.280022  ORF Transcript_89968/g.280022 Transcript_89968/m.280022 type:complete len:754 (-) Transcript_89968:65-2326(-)
MGSADCPGPGTKDWQAELFAVQEELLDRKLRQVSREIIAAVEAEFIRLSVELRPAAAPTWPNAESSGCYGPRGTISVATGQAGPELQRGRPGRPSASPGRPVGSHRESLVAAMGSDAEEHDPQVVGHGHGVFNAEDSYENDLDITRAFTALSAPSRASISVQEVLQMHANQRGGDALSDAFKELGLRFAGAVREVNRLLGIKASTRSKQPAEQISLDTFVAIIQRTVEDRIADLDLMDSLSAIRDILVKEHALRKVAVATNVRTTNIYEATARKPKLSLIDRVARFLNPVASVVILLNAVVIGIDANDNGNALMWDWIEGAFSVMFILELIVRLTHLGTWGFCFGPDSGWNLFDAVVVLASTVQMAFTVFVGSNSQAKVVSLLRLLRLAKLVRVLKLSAFKELTLMVSSILSGARTLMWAIVTLGYLLFVVGVVLAQFFGSGHADQASCDHYDNAIDVMNCVKGVAHLDKYRHELFGDLSRSFFTVFRCLTDGCSSVDGTPLIPHLVNVYGTWLFYLYMILMSSVIFGLFNLIMAVMVEGTIQSAKRYESREKVDSFTEHLNVALKLQEAVVMFCTGADAEENTSASHSYISKLGQVMRGVLFKDRSGHIGKEVSVQDSDDDKLTNTNLTMQITPEVFQKVLEKPEVQRHLRQLGISFSDSDGLFSTLDANCNGTIEIGEMVQGLLKLRGADSEDSVATLLAVRSMQRSIKAMTALHLSQQRVMRRLEAALKSRSLGAAGIVDPMADLRRTVV